MTIKAEDVARALKADESGYSGWASGYWWSLDRDHPEDDWYIQVRTECGGYLYDGWWRGSEDEPLVAAVEEAIDGACVNEETE